MAQVLSFYLAWLFLCFFAFFSLFWLNVFFGTQGRPGRWKFFYSLEVGVFLQSRIRKLFYNGGTLSWESPTGSCSVRHGPSWSVCSDFPPPVLNSRNWIQGLPWWSSGWDSIFQSRACGSYPWLGSWDSTCLMAKKNQNVRQKQYCNKISKDFKDVPREKIFLLLFSRSVMFSSLWHHGLQHARLPCPSPSPGVCSNSCPLRRWCHPTISSSVVPFSSCLQSFPASGSFLLSQLFASGGQSIGASVSALVLPMNIQGWFSLGWTVLISLLSKGLSSVFCISWVGGGLDSVFQGHSMLGMRFSASWRHRIIFWPLVSCVLRVKR